MEREEFFLFVFYTEDRNIQGLYNRAGLVIRRASMQRAYRVAGQYKRIPVEFDPLTKNMGYCVVAYYLQPDGCNNFIETFVIVGISDTPEGAEKIKEEVANGGHKKIAIAKKEKFDRCETYSVVITQK